MRPVLAAGRTEQVPVAHHRAHVSVPPPARPARRPDRRLPIRSREKYVTRAEYDDLKTRFDHLEAAVARILPASEPRPYGRLPPSPAYRLPSPQASSSRPDPPFPPSSSRPRSPHAAYRLPPPAYPPLRSPSPPLSSSSRLPDARAPPGSRRASLSLAAITNPQPPPQPPKNLRAQTPPSLGQRLRTASARTPGPAAAPLRRVPPPRAPTTSTWTRRRRRAAPPLPRRPRPPHPPATRPGPRSCARRGTSSSTSHRKAAIPAPRIVANSPQFILWFRR